MLRSLLLAALFVVAAPVSAAEDFRTEVVQQLRKAGSDVSVDHQFDFYLYVPQEADAIAAAQTLSERGFAVVTRRAARGANWLCVASATFVPDTTKLAEVGKLLSSLALKYKGEFDGWEAQVVK